MSMVGYLFITVGVPILISIASVCVGTIMKTQGIISPETEIFNFWLLGLLIGAVIGVGTGAFIHAKEVYEKIKPENQIEIPKKKHLPMCYSNAVVRLIIILLIMYMFYNLFDLSYFENNLLLGVILFMGAMLVLTIFVAKLDEHKGSVLVASKLFEETFGDVKTFNDKNYKDSNEDSPIFRSIKVFSKYDFMFEKIKRIFVTSMNFNYETRNCTIGTTDIKVREIHGYGKDKRSNDSIKNVAFIEIEHTIPFEHEVIITKSAEYSGDVVTGKGIIPKYKNLGLIYCENNDYANKIITEQVQLYIAELRAHFRNFLITFAGNKILISIRDAKWSSWFSRTFLKNKVSKDILKSTNVTLEYLMKISYEIEKNQE